MKDFSEKDHYFELQRNENRRLEAQVEELENQLDLAKGRKKKRKSPKVQRRGRLIMFPVGKQGGAQ